MNLYIVEARSQKDEITTPSLHTYKIFRTMEEADQHLDMIYANARRTRPTGVERRDGIVEVRPLDGGYFPRQTWHIKIQHI